MCDVGGEVGLTEGELELGDIGTQFLPGAIGLEVATDDVLEGLPSASHGCSCCGPASRADTVSIPDASDSSAGGSSPSYQVTGLTCGHCAKSVTQALQALPQVDDVQVDLASGGVSTVTVTGVVPPEMIRRAIEATGYTVLS